jgi:carbon starvation protein
VIESKINNMNSIVLIISAVCVYLIAYRLYASWICAKVLCLDENRQTPAQKFNDGKDFIPTNKWIVFGHHFAAIAGPGPLIGPTLAAQFGFMPGMVWILVGAVLGGAVQDMVVMFFSVRSNGESLGQMARRYLGRIGGFVALFGSLLIIIILISVLGLVVVKAMRNSPWATFTVMATIPIAIIIGLYMRFLRPGRVIEASLLGLSLTLLAVIVGDWVAEHDMLSHVFNINPKSLALFVIGYGFIAAVVPVWLLLAPRDYLSTFLKLGTVFLLFVAVIILAPKIQMPAMTRFVDGTGPIFAGKIFPFMFITIACGAISGFHALIASGTTPKMLMNEKDIRLIGYGSMLLESMVAMIALVAACILEPGVYFAINSPTAIIGDNLEQVCTTISSWGFKLEPEMMKNLAHAMGEETLLSRTGGAPSLAVGMAQILSRIFGESLLAFWYHFAIMFEAIFILTTLDAGTRVARFILQDFLGSFYKPLGDTSSYPANIFASFLVVSGWGYFLYVGIIDPNGGVNMLWPLFGIANQMLATIALCVVTAIMAQTQRLKYIWVTAVPALFLVLVTTRAAMEKIFSEDPRIGYLSAAKSAGDLAINQYIVTGLTVVFLVVVWTILINTLYKVSLSWRLNK